MSANGRPNDTRATPVSLRVVLVLVRVVLGRCRASGQIGAGRAQAAPGAARDRDSSKARATRTRARCSR